MKEIVAEYFGSDIGTSLVTLIIAIVVAFFGGREYLRQLRSEAQAIAEAYKAAINASRASLKFAHEEFESVLEDRLPACAVYDFCKEDWFSIHNQLCGSLGKLVHLNEEKGREAVNAISDFYEQFKGSREFYAYLVTLQKAVAILEERDADSHEIHTTRQKLTTRKGQMTAVLGSAQDKAKKECDTLDELQLRGAKNWDDILRASSAKRKSKL